MLKQITPSAQKVMKAKGLLSVVDSVLREIQTIPSTDSRARKVEVEWERDPEVEEWELISVTLWAEGSPEDARDLWREVDLAMTRLRQRLTPGDLDKLNRYVSVGVDIE